MTRITDDLAQSTDYVYDERGRLSLTTYADSGTVALCYAFGSSPIRSIDQRGIDTVYLYDSLHRLTKKQDDVSSPAIVETHEYDGVSRITLAILTKSGRIPGTDSGDAIRIY